MIAATTTPLIIIIIIIMLIIIIIIVSHIECTKITNTNITQHIGNFDVSNY